MIVEMRSKKKKKLKQAKKHKTCSFKLTYKCESLDRDVLRTRSGAQLPRNANNTRIFLLFQLVEATQKHQQQLL